MADIGMAAFAVFFMQSPSFLAHQRHLMQRHGRSNCETLFAMTKIPSDNHIRAMLDPVRPQCLHPLFADTVAALKRGGGLTAFRRLAGHVLIAFDGTEYYRSAKLHCPRCSTRKRGGGSIEYFHSLVAATLVAPGHNRVVALQPEFVVPQDGHDKQGTTSEGGNAGAGTAFELTPTEGGSWTQQVLHSFGIGTDGARPNAGLVFDAAGNLYGTTYFGGTNNSMCSCNSCGTVFELTYSGGALVVPGAA